MSAVSIVVPCYKVEKYIGQLIESIQAQTFKDIEVILVEDGSPDKTGAICDEYAANDPRLHVIHKANGGVSAARNDGLQATSGEYIIFCDSDDYLPEDAIEVLYQKAVQTDADIVIGDMNQIFDKGEKKGGSYAEEFVIEDAGQIQELIKAVFYKTYCPWPNQGKAAFGYSSPCNKLVRRKLLFDNGIHFDTRVKGIYDDYIYSAYILAVSKRVAYIPQNVYNYRILATSITHAYKSDTPEINEAIFEVWSEFLQEYDQKSAYTAAYYANVLQRLDESLSRYYFNPDNPKSFIKEIQDLQKAMDTSPYKDIPRFADVDKLGKRHRMECRLLKIGSAFLMWAFYESLLLYRKVKSQ